MVLRGPLVKSWPKSTPRFFGLVFKVYSILCKLKKNLAGPSTFYICVIVFWVPSGSVSGLHDSWSLKVHMWTLILSILNWIAECHDIYWLIFRSDLILESLDIETKLCLELLDKRARNNIKDCGAQNQEFKKSQ